MGINVPDLDIARAYYGALLPRVGFEPFVDDDTQFAFMPADGKRGTYLFFYPAPGSPPYSRHTTTGLQHLAFMVRSRSDVDDVHAWAASSNSEIVQSPRVFPEYPPPYYAAFFLDPFGIMIEVVCHHDRD